MTLQSDVTARAWLRSAICDVSVERKQNGGRTLFTKVHINSMLDINVVLLHSGNTKQALAKTRPCTLLISQLICY